MTSGTYKKDVMRWVNTGYSISFRCGTAVAVDNAGILFFVIDANVNRVLIVYIVYHIVGVWRRLLASQPSCPTCVCNFLTGNYRQWIRSLVLSMRFAQPWAEFGRSRSLKPWAVLSWLFQQPYDRGVGGYLWLFGNVDFTQMHLWTSGLCPDPVTVGC